MLLNKHQSRLNQTKLKTNYIDQLLDPLHYYYYKFSYVPIQNHACLMMMFKHGVHEP